MVNSNFPKKLFILGAGSSAHSGAPLGRQFVNLLFSMSKKDERINNLRSFIEHLFPWCTLDITRNSLGMTDFGDISPKFEEILSFIDIAIQRNESFDQKYQEREIIQLKNDLHYLIWKTLEFVKDMGKEDLHSLFIEKMIKPDSAIISLNYDTLIDYSLENHGYKIDYGMEFDQSCGYDEPKSLIEGDSPRAISLAKVHGSLNWLYCPSCYKTFKYSSKNLKNVFAAEPELCPDDHTYLKGAIVPPTYLKNYANPLLRRVWTKAGSLLGNATKIYIIGCSFSDADMWFKFLAKKFILLNKNNPKIIVINPERRGELKNRYQRILGPITYVSASFSDWIHSS